MKVAIMAKMLTLINDNKTRCNWCNKSELYQRYHDEEWGIPVHDDVKHFEFLLLETMQAGLSWITILNKRENYRQVFADFNPVKVAQFDDTKVEELMQDVGIIRNRLKIKAAINNAKLFLATQAEFGSFDSYIWQFTNGEVIQGNWCTLSEIPITSALSDTVAKDLKKRGFKFVGSTTIYAHLQAIGVINDHLVSCWKYNL